MYYDESLPTFFRRLSFTPDGSLLLTPAALYHPSYFNNAAQINKSLMNETTATTSLNGVYIFGRNNLQKPIACLTGLKKPAICIRCCPVLFQLRPLKDSGLLEGIEEKENEISRMIDLPYRMIFAVGTIDSVIIYDTQQSNPIGLISNFHYASITDLAWSHDGILLFISSRDGFCSTIKFNPGELGKEYVKKQTKESVLNKVEEKVFSPLVEEETKQDEDIQEIQVANSQEKEPIIEKEQELIGMKRNIHNLEESNPLGIQSHQTNNENGSTVISNSSSSNSNDVTNNNPPKKRRIVPQLISLNH